MRPIFCALFAIMALIGIPWLVNALRGEPLMYKAPAQVAAVTLPVNKPPMKDAVAAAPAMPSTLLLEKPAVAQLVPVSLQSSQALPAAAGPAPSVPANEKELIFAIQHELNRLHYYDGPSNGKWSAAVRVALQHFLRQNGERGAAYPLPTIELLTVLQAATPVKPHEASRSESARLDAEAARAPRLSLKDPAPKAAAAASEPAALPDEDYLPPWMRGAARTAIAEPSTGSAGPQEYSETRAGVPEAPRRAHHRAHRPARSAYYGGYGPRRLGRGFFPY